MTLARPTYSLWLLLLCLLAGPAFGQTDFVTFESGQVRPLLLTPDGNTLLALNTPDNTLEIFSVGAGGLVHTGSVPVGMEPVALAIPGNVANEDEVWVVNQPGMPFFVITANVVWDGYMDGATGSGRMEYSIFDVNAEINIQPPVE